MNVSLIPNRSVTLVTSDRRVLTATKDNPNWKAIVDAIKANDEVAAIEAISIKETIKKFGKGVTGRGDIEIRNNQILYRGERLFGEDITRILAYITEGYPQGSLIRFLERKLKNPSPVAVASLYTFLQNRQMPVTPNGTILGYKGVSATYNSIHTGAEPLIKGIRNPDGSVANLVGEEVWMDRQYVCADNTNGCAAGLHIGSKNYAHGWGAKVMVVEFSPEDVVSVPDNEHEKLRVCRYRVVGELNGDVLGNVFNDAYVRPDNTFDPDMDLDGHEDTDSDVDGENGIGMPYEDEEVQVPDDYMKGKAMGIKDGRAHQKRKFYEVDIAHKFRHVTRRYVQGYLDGYRRGRNN